MVSSGFDKDLKHTKSFLYFSFCANNSKIWFKVMNTSKVIKAKGRTFSKKVKISKSINHI